MPIKLLMPQLGESVVEGTVTKWLVHEGEAVAREQAVVVVGTDKADTEVHATAAGTIVKIVAPEGRTVKVGEPMCEIDENAPVAVAAPSSSRADPVGAPIPSAPSQQAARGPETASSQQAARGSETASSQQAARGSETASSQQAEAGRTGRTQSASELPTVQQVVHRRASPVARKLALQQGGLVALPEPAGSIAPEATQAGAALAPVPESPARPGRQAGGVDPELVNLLNSGVLVPVPGVGFGAYRVPPYQPREGDEVVPFNRRRRLLAHHMAYSKITAPHVVTVSEVDLFRTTQLREAHKDHYKKEGVPLTMLAFLCQATVRALREFPTMNARVLEDSYVLLKEVNLGIAVDAREGLIVPNIKRADELSLRGLARAIDEVAQRARSGNIRADDLAGSSFSVSNPGLKGNLFGGAIIAQPNVGILRMGKIQKRVVVLENDGQDVLAVHPVMYLALSYDHRIIDGVLGNAFLYRVTEILEKADFEV